MDHLSNAGGRQVKGIKGIEAFIFNQRLKYTKEPETEEERKQLLETNKLYEPVLEEDMSIGTYGDITLSSALHKHEAELNRTSYTTTDAPEGSSALQQLQQMRIEKQGLDADNAQLVTLKNNPNYQHEPYFIEDRTILEKQPTQQIASKQVSSTLKQVLKSNTQEEWIEENMSVNIPGLGTIGVNQMGLGGAVGGTMNLYNATASAVNSVSGLFGVDMMPEISYGKDDQLHADNTNMEALKGDYEKAVKLEYTNSQLYNRLINLANNAGSITSGNLLNQMENTRISQGANQTGVSGFFQNIGQNIVNDVKQTFGALGFGVLDALGINDFEDITLDEMVALNLANFNAMSTIMGLTKPEISVKNSYSIMHYQDYAKEKLAQKNSHLKGLGYLYVRPFPNKFQFLEGGDTSFEPHALEFQFSPKIDEGSIQAKYATEDMLNRIGSLRTYIGTEPGVVTIETEYLALTENGFSEKETNFGLTENENPGNTWMYHWDLKYIRNMEKMYRSLVMPVNVTYKNMPGILKPPMVKIILATDFNGVASVNDLYKYPLTDTGWFGNSNVNNSYLTNTRLAVASRNSFFSHKTYIVTDVKITYDDERHIMKYPSAFDARPSEAHLRYFRELRAAKADANSDLSIAMRDLEYQKESLKQLQNGYTDPNTNEFIPGYKQLESELKQLQKDLDNYSKEMDKILNGTSANPLNPLDPIHGKIAKLNEKYPSVSQGVNGQKIEDRIEDLLALLYGEDLTKEKKGTEQGGMQQQLKNIQEQIDNAKAAVSSAKEQIKKDVNTHNAENAYAITLLETNNVNYQTRGFKVNLSLVEVVENYLDVIPDYATYYLTTMKFYNNTNPKNTPFTTEGKYYNYNTQEEVEPQIIEDTGPTNNTDNGVEPGGSA